MNLNRQVEQLHHPSQLQLHEAENLQEIIEVLENKKRCNWHNKGCFMW